MNKTVAMYLQEHPELKPKVKLIGKDGNIFNLMALCSRPLGEIPNAYKEMVDRITNSNSYLEALSIISEYVNIY